MDGTSGKFFTARHAIYLGLGLRVLVAIWNSFFGPSYGAGADAVYLQNIALDFVLHIVRHGFMIGYTYAYALGMIYALTVKSLFLGCLLSCAAWLISANLLVKIMGALSLSPASRFKAMLIYALLPSSILFTSVTMREVYQLMFVNMAMYALLKIIMDRQDRYWVVLLFAALGGSAMHGTFFVFGFGIVIVALVANFFRDDKHRTPLMRFLFVILIIMICICAFLWFPIITRYNILRGLDRAIQNYQRGGLMYHDFARTFYKTSVNIKGVPGLLLFIPVSLFQYLFEPMPWHMTSIIDLQALFENIIRAWLIFMALFGVWKLKSLKRSAVLVMILSYFILETTWSLGTLSWGTAIRHHISAMGLLVVAAFSYHGAAHGSKK